MTDSDIAEYYEAHIQVIKLVTESLYSIHLQQALTAIATIGETLN